MTMRKTSYLRLRYPWTDDVVSAADVDSMAQDIDQALVSTATLAANFSKMASVVVQRAAAQSITKATLTAITFDTEVLDNGANSPVSNGGWYNPAAPTRLTAPVPCVVLASCTAGIDYGTSMGANGAWEVLVALNGATGGTGVQGTKWAIPTGTTGQSRTSALTMWKLVAGDFLELKVFWTGTPAGPLTTNTTIAPVLSLMMVGLPSVA